MTFVKKNIIYLIVLIVLAVVAFVPGVKETLKTTFLPVAEVEQALKIDDADYSIALKGINTPNTNLKNFKGKKVLFLNFWGTWCPPCRKEWPSIQKLYDGHKDKMDFVLIAMLNEEAEVRKFVQENNYTAPVYIAESPINGKILPKVYPTTFILDKNGRILKKETTSKDWNTPSIISFVEEVTR